MLNSLIALRYPDGLPCSLLVGAARMNGRASREVKAKMALFYPLVPVIVSLPHMLVAKDHWSGIAGCSMDCVRYVNGPCVQPRQGMSSFMHSRTEFADVWDENSMRRFHTDCSPFIPTCVTLLGGVGLCLTGRQTSARIINSSSSPAAGLRDRPQHRQYPQDGTYAAVAAAGPTSLAHKIARKQLPHSHAAKYGMWQQPVA